MAATDPIRGSCYAGRSCLLMARVLVNIVGEATYVKQANLTSISYVVWNRGVQVGLTGTLVIADVIYDTLQTGSTWTTTIDSTGGNFSFELSGDYLPDADEMYTVTVTFAPTGGEEFDVEFEIATLNPRG